MHSSLAPGTSRRRFVIGAGLAALFGIPGSARSAGLSIAALFAGNISDSGFMESGWRGLERARSDLGATTWHIAGIAPDTDQLIAALTRLAEAGADLIIAHGGQNNAAAQAVAARFPRQQFVVTQGAVTGANLSSYEVLQEESAYLAGVLAASMTRSGVVGHMSGIRVRPGLKGRAAFAAGVRDTDPKVRLLTNFSGQQDDNALSRSVALAEVAAGADVIFTMLNAGREGVTGVCRESGIRQIGNVIDWVGIDPGVFIASAVADVSTGVFNAARDLLEGRFESGVVRKVGLRDPAAVRLTMADDVPRAVRLRVEQAAAGIRGGHIQVPDRYDGEEFATPASSSDTGTRSR